MSRIIASNYVVSSGIAIDLVTANEYAYVAAGVTAGSENGTAIVVRADHNQIENFGSIVGLVGIVASGGAALNTRILNHAGASIYGFDGVGVGVQSGLQLYNDGLIHGLLHGVEVTDPGGGNRSDIFNTGVIESLSNDAIAHDGPGSAVLSVTNSGTIRAGSGQFAFYSYSANNRVDYIVNTGQITGQVYLGDGNDSIDTHIGKVAGNIGLGDGDDTAYGSAAADSIDGGLGNDLIRGNAGKDILDGGGGGNDIADYREKTVPVSVALNGATVANVLVNLVAEDAIKNFEIVYGGSANDKLTGDGLSNGLYGNNGNDVLSGGAGADLLRGGTGVDTATGGTTNDTFQFSAVTDSGITAASRDIITDFKHAEADKIDLHLIDANTALSADQSFAFNAAKGTATSAVATGHVAWYWEDNTGTTNDHTIIKLNNDADAAIESTIQLNGLINLTATDFVL